MKRTHCKHGHPLAGANLYRIVRPDGDVERGCRSCRREAGRRRDAKLAARVRAGLCRWPQRAKRLPPIRHFAPDEIRAYYGITGSTAA